jgi:hypothetical protein
MLVSWLPSAKVIEVSEIAPLNALYPMLVTPAGMVMEVSPLEEKAYAPMLVTPAGMVIEVSPLEEKAYAPMLVSWLPAAKLMEVSADAL